MVEGGNNFFVNMVLSWSWTPVLQGQEKKAEVCRWMINRLLASSAADDHGLAMQEDLEEMQEDLEETRGWQQNAGA